ncbi:MAG: hypothetical protein HQ465_22360 [Rhodospirillales bacterium]|nr:hypothetical protein [Rhodospirillales bacterium]
MIDKVEDFIFDDELLLIAEDGANLVLRNLPLAIIAKGKFWVNMRNARPLSEAGAIAIESLVAARAGFVTARQVVTARLSRLRRCTESKQHRECGEENTHLVSPLIGLLIQLKDGEIEGAGRPAEGAGLPGQPGPGPATKPETRIEVQGGRPVGRASSGKLRSQFLRQRLRGPRSTNRDRPVHSARTSATRSPSLAQRTMQRPPPG